jgi:hypothetical protein
MAGENAGYLIQYSDKTLAVAKKQTKKRAGSAGYPIGRPTKKTPTLVATLLRLISDGGPYDLCCKAVGITRETFYDWRRDDPAFAARVEQAAAKGSLDRLKKIEQHGQNDWHAFGWMLERRHPEYFAKAETQLTVNQSVSTGPANVIVLGPERAKVLATRYQQIRAKTIAMFEGQTGNTGNGSQAEAQPPRRTELPAFAAVVEEATGPTVPTSEPSPPFAWWRQFLFPVLGTLIHKTEATKALRLILGELRIVAEEQRLSFQTDHITQATFCEVLEKLTGGDLGWRTMVQIYERELRRSDH